ncbi:hypothetical protein LXA43DRAFT_1095432 [Ganoderma leucocontextum]|nr:hypothetical protein LXA43DRAFT_1095432 [Ganoderma leucocontextum]
MSRYTADFPFNLAFPLQAMLNVFTDWLPKHGVASRSSSPTPKIATYDKLPKMSVDGVGEGRGGSPRGYTQLPGVQLRAGHTGLITADHGNAEQLINAETGALHTTNAVPFTMMSNLRKYAFTVDMKDSERARLRMSLCTISCVGVYSSPRVSL